MDYLSNTKFSEIFQSVYYLVFSIWLFRCCHSDYDDYYKLGRPLDPIFHTPVLLCSLQWELLILSIQYYINKITCNIIYWYNRYNKTQHA